MKSSAKQVRYAGFWLRVLVGIIDYIVVGILGTVLLGMSASIINFLQMREYTNHIGIAEIWVISLFCFNLLYFSFLLSSSWQATVGMRVFSLKITGYDYQRINFGLALLREISTFLSQAIVYIGFLMIAFTKKKQGLHDLIANTYVIRD